MSAKLQRALDALMLAIEAGGEYPDEEYRISTKFNVKADDLRAAYDAEHA